MSGSLRVAVADDERDMRDYLKEVLPRLGHQVVGVAENGQQLLDCCQAQNPDLIITDVRMPGIDGFQAVAAYPVARPVIVVSGHHDDDTLGRIGLDPVMAYLVKPISEADLKAAIVVAMLRYQHFQSLRKEVADLRQALEDRKIIERAKGVLMRRVQLREDDAFRRLREQASEHQVKLAEMARKVMAAESVLAQFERS